MNKKEVEGIEKVIKSNTKKNLRNGDLGLEYP